MVTLIDQLMDELARDVQDDDAARFDAMLRAMVGDDDLAHMVDTLEYVEDMEDRAWHARGMW